MPSSRQIEPWEELYRYWLSRHVAGRPPRRADIDPMIDLPHMASNLILIEVRPEAAQYRLVGSDVVNHFGVDQTGKPVGDSNIDPVQLTAWRQAVEIVATGGKPRMLVAHYAGAEKSQTIALVLPLAPDADGVTKVFGATFFGRPFPNAEAFADLAVNNVVLDL
jgi:hypothetical protein